MPDRCLRVLIVDDDPDGRVTLAHLFRILGCETDDCGDGESCLARVQAFKPDLLLLDLAMPRMDGFQVLASLEDADLAPPFVMALSGYGDAKILERCFTAGFDRHALKPLLVDQLQEIIAQAKCRIRPVAVATG